MLCPFNYFLLLCVPLHLCHNSGLHFKYNPVLEEAIQFINNFQQHNNCTGENYYISDIGINGGLAAQFQLAGSEWMRLIYATNFTRPVLIIGRLNGYSDGLECKQVNHDWTCFFMPMSSCQEVLLKTGKEIKSPPIKHIPLGKDIIPPKFSHFGFNFWWGVVQYKMFRFQKHVEQYIMEEGKTKDNGIGFPFGIPTVGMHVRHGDKFVDGFHEHSLSEEVEAVTKSPDCFIKNKNKLCFSKVSLEDYHSMLRLVKHHALIIEAYDVNCFHFDHQSSMFEMIHQEECNQTNVVDHKKLLHYSIVFNGNGSAAKSFRSPRISSEDAFLEPLSGNTSELNSGHYRFRNNKSSPLVTPLEFFVASDDLQVLELAQKLGFMADTSGVSQQTAQNGMLKTLLSHPEYGFNATLEVLSDIYFLSQCSSLLGIAGSQVYRIAVALSNVTNTLRYAVAMDTDQLNKVRHLSWKYSIPFPEEFSKP